MQWRMLRAENVAGGKPRDIREEPSMWRLPSRNIWEEPSMSRERSRATYRKSQVCGGSPPATYGKLLMAGRHQGIEGRQAKQYSHGCSILMGGRRQGGTGEGRQ